MEKLYTVSKNKTGSWLWLRSWTPYCQGKVTQSCPTLCDPMGCSLPGSSVHGIFQAIVLEWIVISFSKGSSRPRDRTRVSHIVDRHLTVWATREASGFPYFLQFKSEFCNKESWSEPQSAPGLVFADWIELLHLWLQRILSIWFWYWPSGDVQCCWNRVFAVTGAFSWQNSVSLCPALFCTPRPNLPTTPGISWLPTFAF